MKRLLPLVFLFALLAPADDLRTVTILHTNDLHARISPLENGHGGFAYLAAAIRHERENCTGCLLLNAGDVVQGSPVSTIFRGLPVYEIANEFGYDAGTLGNHEFDYGWMQVRKFVETARYPIVTSNLVDDHGGLFTKEPYVILNANGVKVAVIGLMTEDLVNLSTPALRGPWHTTRIAETLRRYAAEAKAKADIVVVLSHITPEEEAAVLRLSPDLPVFISGHAHDGVPAPVTYENRLVARVKAYGEELGRLELSVNLTRKSLASWNWKRIPIDSRAISPDPKVAALVNDWEAKVDRIVDVPLATSERELTKPEVRALIERAMREQTGSDFAFMNQGGVRDILPKGQLRERHIWNIMPFDNRLMIGTFKGSQLPPSVTRGRAVDANREYTLVVSDFTAANQAAPSQLGVTGLVFPKSGPIMRDAIIEWIRQQKVLK